MNGIVRERQVAKKLREGGCLVASRRHEGGAGDLLVMDQSGQGHLIEVKATRRPYERFGPADRAALSLTASHYGLVAMLAHWPANGQLRFLHEAVWPETRVAV